MGYHKKLVDDSAIANDLFEQSLALTTKAKDLYPAGVTRVSIGTSQLAGQKKELSIYAQSGDGAFFIDVDGNSFTDFHSNFSTLIHGHQHPDIIQAIQSQLEQGTCFGGPTEADITFASLLCERIPAIERLRFLNSGTEAVMFAIKAARAATGRTKIAKFEGAFHGTYDWAEVSVRSNPDTWGNIIHPHSNPPYLNTPDHVCKDVVVLPFNDIDQSKKILDEHGPSLACLLIDMLPCAAGMMPIERDYLSMLQEAAHKYKIITISDEVVCFRLGYHGASAAMEFEPDLVTLGKVVGGGLPIGVVGGRAEIMEVFAPQGNAPVPQGGTFSANPLTMVAGAAALNALVPSEINRIDRLGKRLRQGSEELALKAGVLLTVQGAGSLFRFHAKKTRPRTFRSAFANAAETEMLRWLHAAMLERGIYIAAPLWGAISTAMTEEHIDNFLNALRECLARWPEKQKS
ncbi:MAG: aspartate aminotransferase family protein [Hyphomicrobiales bacterium]|nr:MAG: aspartate aminotransferase family protein [Hyphomicrobiales bacterium]